MEINQILVSASPGDAIYNAAIETQALLRRVAPSKIYARYIHPEVADHVLPLHAYGRRALGRPDHDLLLFHASIGEPEVFAFLRSRAERIVLVYHNISPSEMFMAYDPAFAGLLEAGRRELAELRGRVSMAIAVSDFNGRELRAMGYRDVRVVPLIVDSARLGELEPDPQTENHLQTQVEGTVFLFVGQLLPHKRPDFLVQAFHVVATYLDPDAHLVLAGSPRLPLPRSPAGLHPGTEPSTGLANRAIERCQPGRLLPARRRVRHRQRARGLLCSAAGGVFVRDPGPGSQLRCRAGDG